MDMNIELIKSAIPLLIAGAGITVEITALSVFFGMLIGIIVALAQRVFRYADRYHSSAGATV